MKDSDANVPVPVPTGKYAGSAVEAMQIKQKVMSQLATDGKNKYYIPRVPVDFSEEEYEHLEDEEHQLAQSKTRPLLSKLSQKLQ